jgi:phage-related tail fiber protein
MPTKPKSTAIEKAGPSGLVIPTAAAVAPVELEETFADLSLEMTPAGDKFRVADALQTKLAGIAPGADVTLAALAANVAAPVNVNGQKITQLAAPTEANDAATKAYVDATAQGLDVKHACRLLATTNVALSGLAAIDGVVPVAGDRILCIGQTTQSANGIYVAAAGAWARATDADSSDEVAAGMYVFITQGSAAYADTGWILTTDDPIVLGTSALVFAQFSSASAIVAGNGLTRTGQTLAVGANADGSIAVSPDDIKVGVLATDAQHGNRGGGATHAIAVAGGAAGFLSGADKTKIDGHKSSHLSGADTLFASSFSNNSEVARWSDVNTPLWPQLVARRMMDSGQGTGSTTFGAAAALLVGIPRATKYIFEAELIYHSSVNTEYLVARAACNCTVSMVQYSMRHFAVGSNLYQNNETAFGGNPAAPGGTNAPGNATVCSIHIFGSFVASSPGALQIEFRASSGGAQNVTLHAGSWLKVDET